MRPEFLQTCRCLTGCTGYKYRVTGPCPGSRDLLARLDESLQIH
jgi:hypothetical protein